MKCIQPKYKIGDLVVVKSYPDISPLEGNPDLIPPIMVVVGIEIEGNKKKTYNNDFGLQISERTKYEVLWFDSNKSMFFSKIIYESFLKIKELKITAIQYRFGAVTRFKPSILELQKKRLLGLQ